MANALYPKWKEQLLQFISNNNLSSDTVKVALVDTVERAAQNSGKLGRCAGGS